MFAWLAQGRVTSSAPKKKEMFIKLSDFHELKVLPSLSMAGSQK